MKINDEQTVVCYDGITRKGRVVYIHPDNIFRVLEFKGRMGSWREAIANNRSTPRKISHRPYTAAEDKAILRMSAVSAAKKLGRSLDGVRERRKKLIREKRMKKEENRTNAKEKRPQAG